MAGAIAGAAIAGSVAGAVIAGNVAGSVAGSVPGSGGSDRPGIVGRDRPAGRVAGRVPPAMPGSIGSGSRGKGSMPGKPGMPGMLGMLGTPVTPQVAHCNGGQTAKQGPGLGLAAEDQRPGTHSEAKQSHRDSKFEACGLFSSFMVTAKETSGHAHIEADILPCHPASWPTV